MAGLARFDRSSALLTAKKREQSWLNRSDNITPNHLGSSVGFVLFAQHPLQPFYDDGIER